jgi:hypothetical protein
MGEMRNAYQILDWKPEGRERPLGRPRSRLENSIKSIFKKRCFEGVDWIHVAQDRDQLRAVNTVMNF